MNERRMQAKIFVASPLEEAHVETIRARAPAGVAVVWEPDLLPPTRYVADHKGAETFARTPAQEERWRTHLTAADILWDFPPIPADFALARNVKWVQTTSSGVGQMVSRMGLADSDLLVTTARGIHARPLTDFVFLALLTHVKQLRFLEGEQRARRWARYCGDGLAGKTLAVIGAGGVGRRVLAVGRAFGMRTIALASPGSTRSAAEIGADEVFPPDGLHDLLGEADALVLSLPHTPASEGLIDAAAIAALKPGSVFVNIARGQVVDEDALIAALRSDHIAFAALDVFAVEPLPQESPLWDLSNVLISPHSASTVASENQAIVDIFCHNLDCYMDGRVSDMKNVLDKARMY